MTMRTIVRYDRFASKPMCQLLLWVFNSKP